MVLKNKYKENFFKRLISKFSISKLLRMINHLIFGEILRMLYKLYAFDANNNLCNECFSEEGGNIFHQIMQF